MKSLERLPYFYKIKSFYKKKEKDFHLASYPTRNLPEAAEEKISTPDKPSMCLYIWIIQKEKKITIFMSGFSF